MLGDSKGMKKGLCRERKLDKRAEKSYPKE